MPVRLEFPPELLAEPFTGSYAESLGVPRRRLNGQAFARLFRDVYVSAAVQVDEATRRRAAILLVPGAALSHTSAAEHWRFPLPLSLHRDVVHLAVGFGAQAAHVRGLRVHELRLGSGDVVTDGGVAVLSPSRTMLDLAPWLSLADLTAATDWAVRQGLVTKAELAESAYQAKGHRGVRRLRGAVGLCDPGAESPQESRLRVVLVCAGLPRPECNVDIDDAREQFIARGDLVYREHKVVVEYDGAVHLEDAQRIRDAARRNDLLAAGWTVLTFTSESMRAPDDTVRTVWDALVSRGWNPPTPAPTPLESGVIKPPKRPR